jgi:pimeloyl-ACP methyl ester carboxylesterase
MGADYRAFSRITLPMGYNTLYIHWIPAHKKEKLADYALRLASQIDTSTPFILVGLSMGGMMAAEIAKKFPPVCTILIRSIPVATQLPPYYRWAGRLHAPNLVSPSLLKVLKAAARFKQALTWRPSPASQLTCDMLQEADNGFLRWSMMAVLEWSNSLPPHPLHHIHGTKDRILPIRFTHPTQVVPKAGHTLVMSHPNPVPAAHPHFLITGPMPAAHHPFPHPRSHAGSTLPRIPPRVQPFLA